MEPHAGDAGQMPYMIGIMSNGHFIFQGYATIALAREIFFAGLLKCTATDAT